MLVIERVPALFVSPESEGIFLTICALEEGQTPFHDVHLPAASLCQLGDHGLRLGSSAFPL